MRGTHALAAGHRNGSAVIASTLDHIEGCTPAACGFAALAVQTISGMALTRVFYVAAP
jgi:hypothetical protein